MGKGEGLGNNEPLPHYFYHLFPFASVSVTRIFAVIILIRVGPWAVTSIRVFSLWLHFAIVLLRCNHLLVKNLRSCVLLWAARSIAVR